LRCPYPFPPNGIPLSSPWHHWYYASQDDARKRLETTSGPTLWSAWMWTYKPCFWLHQSSPTVPSQFLGTRVVCSSSYGSCHMSGVGGSGAASTDYLLFVGTQSKFGYYHLYEARCRHISSLFFDLHINFVIC